MTGPGAGHPSFGHRARRLAIAGVVCLVQAPLSFVWAEIEINPNGWKFPNVVTAAKEIIRISDRTRDIPGKETILKGYRKWDGTYFRTYEIEGRIFGVEIDTDGKPPFEYSIMDTDGDGKFETKIPHEKGNTDRAYVPQWVIDYYYQLHPELKEPGSNVKVVPPSLRPPVLTPPAPPPASDDPPPDEVRQRPAP